MVGALVCFSVLAMVVVLAVPAFCAASVSNSAVSGATDFAGDSEKKDLETPARNFSSMMYCMQTRGRVAKKRSPEALATPSSTAPNQDAPR